MKNRVWCMQHLKGFTDRDTKVPRQKRPINGVKDLDTWIRIDPGVSTYGGDHSQKYLESHKLAGFRVHSRVREICTRNPIISKRKTVRYYGIKHLKPDPLREWRPTHFETVLKDSDTCPATCHCCLCVNHLGARRDTFM